MPRQQKSRKRMVQTVVCPLACALAVLTAPSQVWACGGTCKIESWVRAGDYVIPVGTGASGPWEPILSPDPNLGGSITWGAVLGEADPTSGISSTFYAGSESGTGGISISYVCEGCYTGCSEYHEIIIAKVVDIDPNKSAVAVDSSLKLLAVTEPTGYGCMDFIEMSATDCNVVDPNLCNYIITRSTPGTATVTAHCGTSSASRSVKFVGLDGAPDANVALSVSSNATASKYQPGTWVACWQDSNDAWVEITANLTPGCSDQEAREVLSWNIPQKSASDPWTKRYISLKNPARTSVTAWCGNTTASLDILVISVDSIRVSDADTPQRFRRNPPDANDLYLPEREVPIFGACAPTTVSVSVSPLEGLDYVVGTVDGDQALPSKGSFGGSTGSVPVILRILSGGNRDFTFHVGVDLDGSARLNPTDPTQCHIDCCEQQLTAHVVAVDVRVDSNNDGQIDESDDDIEANAPGKVLALNSDTDNGDANNPDCNVPLGPVSGEDDLVPAHLSVLGAPEDRGQWCLSFSSQVRAYLNANKTGPILANAWAPRSTMPSVVYLEGMSCSGSAGDAWITLWYELPDLPTTVITDTAALTVATVEFTNVTLPNGFLGTLDDDPNLTHWSKGIRQRARNTIRVQYQIVPSMAFSCDTSEVTLKYRGRQWTGPEQSIDANLVLCSCGGLVGATANVGPPVPVLVGLDFPQDIDDPSFAGVCTTVQGGHYWLTLDSSRSGVRFVSRPYEIEAKALVEGFDPEPNDPNGFCPYTVSHWCPGDPNLGCAGELYSGVAFKYFLNGDLVGWDAEGTLQQLLLGDSVGLDVQIVGVKRLRTVRSQKKARGYYAVKWEGFDATVDEPGGEPVFWGPNDPNRQSMSNIANYPALNLVPDHVVPETGENPPYLIRVEAIGAVESGLRQEYGRWNVPVRVRYDLENR